VCLRGDIAIMRCQEVKSLFSEFYDQELNEEILLAVEKHLSKCQECQEEYRIFKKSLIVLKRLKPLDIPRNYLEKRKLPGKS